MSLSSPNDTNSTPTGGDPSRRSMLRAGLGAAAALAAVPAVAACGGGSTATTTPAAGGGGTTAAAGTGAAGTGSSAGGSVVTELANVPVGGATVVKYQGQTVVVAQPTSGNVVAFNAACTHAGCPVAPQDGKLSCPCHGSQFALDTGAVLQGPANQPLAKIPVKIDNGAVVSA